MDLLPEKHETLVLQPGHVKPLPKNATKKQKSFKGLVVGAASLLVPACKKLSL